jgi:RNA polymerase sigma-70 factor (ECF subfamily)
MNTTLKKDLYTKNIHLTDQQIIEKILAGEKAYFEILIRRYNASIYRIGRAYRFNHEDTEDLMQEAHVSAFMNLAKFESRSSYRTWLIRIMINKCLYQSQKTSFTHQLADSDAIQDNVKPMFTHHQNLHTEKQVLDRELAHILEKSIEQIPENYRTVFILREIDGLSVAETAEALQITEANVKVRLNRAKQMLRQRIENSYTSAPVYDFNLIYCDRMVEKVFERINNEMAGRN